MQTDDRRIPGRRAERLARTAVAASGAALIAWQAISLSGGAFAVATGRPEAALRLSPGSAAANDMLAQQAVAAHQWDAARSRALEALRRSPLNAQAVRMLALSLDAMGQVEQGSALFGNAAALGWRDVPTQVAIAGLALPAGDVAEAARRIDATARVVPAEPRIHRLIDELLGNDRFRSALALRAAVRTGWLPIYLGTLDQVPAASLLRRAAFARDIPVPGNVLTRAQMVPLIDRLIASNEVAAARATWVHYAGAQAAAANGAVTNPGFLPAATGASFPFEWRLEAPGDAEAVLGEGGRPGLHVSSIAQRPGPLVRQLMTLAPGRYRFAALGTKPAGQDRLGFRWRLLCTTGADIMTTEEGARDASLAADFVVPAGCGAQWLQLVIDRPDAPGSIEATFTKVDVRPG